MRVIQVVDGYSKGDGVGNAVTAVDELLRKNGYETEIYNHKLPNMLEGSPEEELFSEDTVVLYHLAFVMDPMVRYLPCKKILLYHNITTPELLVGTEEKSRIYCAAGLYDAADTYKYFDAAIADSEYSRQNLISMGWDPKLVKAVPIMVRTENFDREPSQNIIKKYKDGRTNIIFTGRVFPNKKHEDIIFAFAKYKEEYDKDARLLLVGSISNSNYYPTLCSYAHQLGVEDDVVFTGHVAFDEYLAYYHVADVFLCMSEHEGFCIPLVEAMYFRIPIVAYNSSAIPYTLGGSGVLVDKKDDQMIASVLNKLICDKSYREEVLQKQDRRLLELRREKLEKEYTDALCACLNIKQDVSKRMLPSRSPGFQLLPAMDYQLEKSQIKDRELIIYGAGATGRGLVKILQNLKKNIACICDSFKGGKGEDYQGLEVLLPNEAKEQHPQAVYIISVQDKSAIVKIAILLNKLDIPQENIKVYDENIGLL